MVNNPDIVKVDLSMIRKKIPSDLSEAVTHGIEEERKNEPYCLVLWKQGISPQLCY